MDHLHFINSKVFRMDQAFEWQLAVWRFHQRKIVFTNGCFDLLHLGHIEYLAKSAAEGNLLMIGLNTDDSVKRIKGDARPIKDEQSRALSLASMSFVDAVVFFDEDTPLRLIELVQPDVLIKGADYAEKDIVGADVVLGKGGRVVTMDYLPGYSTSALIQQIKNS